MNFKENNILNIFSMNLEISNNRIAKKYVHLETEKTNNKNKYKSIIEKNHKNNYKAQCNYEH